MAYILLGVVILFLVTRAGAMPLLRLRGWKFLNAAAAIAAFAAAAFAAVRGEWVPTVVLLVAGLWLASTARRAGAPEAERAPPSRGMSDTEARAILGVEPDATVAEIRAAHRRLMRMAHPDTGGTTGLATQLNAARDRLLEG